MHQASNSGESRYKIGAVAERTGLSVHTLRKWEDRYGAVDPRRNDRGTRYYTDADIHRLLLIKRLADSGRPPREVASLPTPALSEAVAELGEQARARTPPAEPVRLAVLGGSTVSLVRGSATLPRVLDLIAAADSPEELREALDGREVDLLVYECNSVRLDTRRVVNELTATLGAEAALVFYRFAARSDLASLQEDDIVTLRAPSDSSALEQAVLARMRARARAEASDDDTQVSAPRLSRGAILRLARAAPRTQCECPHHLADIILGLRAFEEYSAACENRHPQDAELHRYLWRCAAQARALFEDAIEHVAEVEGIRLEA